MQEAMDCGWMINWPIFLASLTDQLLNAHPEMANLTDICVVLNLVLKYPGYPRDITYLAAVIWGFRPHGMDRERALPVR